MHNDNSSTRRRMFTTPINPLSSKQIIYRIVLVYKALQNHINWAGQGISKKLNRKFPEEI